MSQLDFFSSRLSPLISSNSYRFKSVIKKKISFNFPEDTRQKTKGFRTKVTPWFLTIILFSLFIRLDWLIKNLSAQKEKKEKILLHVAVKLTWLIYSARSLLKKDIYDIGKFLKFVMHCFVSLVLFFYTQLAFRFCFIYPPI